MKKVVLSLALVAVLGLSFTSCKKSEAAAEPVADSTAVEAPVAEPAATDSAAPAADSAAKPADSAAAPAAAAPAAH